MNTPLPRYVTRRETVYRWGLPYDAPQVKVLQVPVRVKGKWVYRDVKVERECT